MFMNENRLDPGTTSARARSGRKGCAMLKLYYSPLAVSLVSHIALEESWAQRLCKGAETPGTRRTRRYGCAGRWPRADRDAVPGSSSAHVALGARPASRARRRSKLAARVGLTLRSIGSMFFSRG